ncbi:MAG: DUF6456 domain-containing protein [Alphaproteobacteria bacterium]
MARSKAPLGSVLDLVQPDHPYWPAMAQPLLDAVGQQAKIAKDAGRERRRELRERDVDHALRTRGRTIKPTAERESKADVATAWIVDRYRKRGELTKAQANAAETLRTDYLHGHGGAVIGRLVASYHDAPPPAGGPFSPPYTAAEGRACYEAAIEAVGPTLAPILVHVVIDNEAAASFPGLTTTARSATATAGLVTLRLALDALVRHYGTT